MLKKLIIAAAGAAFMIGVSESVQAADFTVLADGLNSPRHLAFGPDGALYVTEAGKGGTGVCISSPSAGGEKLCYGNTGAVTRIQNGTTKRVVTGLPSLALPDGRDANGAHDLAFDSTGKAYILFGLAGDQKEGGSELINSDLGKLVSIDFLNGGTQREQLVDFSAFEGLQNPDGGDLASNPYAFLIKDNKAFVIDAAGNDLLQVGTDGSELGVYALFDQRLVPFEDSDFPLQSVPTSIKIGPDGAFYVGELTGFPYPKNAARVYRINGNQPEVYAEGFTNIIDFDFDSADNLYVLEYATNSILSGDPTGALIRVAPDGTRTMIASEGLISPTSLSISSDDAIYIANNGFIAGQGEVIRIEPTAVPEPSYMTYILGSLFWMLSVRFRNYYTKRNQLKPEITRGTLKV
ncbi:ScyD/ScyE family protein [Nostoc commune]|uniref:ScyD/ScyE family protein n=1 Tax=Nostoc commune TaxID=1178 RepID=UPI001E4D5434|nr:ScyD/ScyE family protein [Nostoc commune]MBG1264671.1 ScyD/ScyE family protein [Nostoc commune BAE]